MLRCKTCRNVVDNEQLANQANCCDNPNYRKIKLIHLVHPEGKGKVYANKTVINSRLDASLALERIDPAPLRLCCDTKAVPPNIMVAPLVYAVTCPKCLEYIRSIPRPVKEN